MKAPVQLDLFADFQPSPAATRIAAEALSDTALIAALPEASLGDAQNLAAEAGRRRLGAAVAALGALCARFAGYGLSHRVPEQIAALEALAAIGGAEAYRARSFA